MWPVASRAPIWLRHRNAKLNPKCRPNAAAIRRDIPAEIKGTIDMIKTALVAMTVVGCDCDANLCEFISETPAQWATVAECEAEMTSQILRQDNFSYPLISGICRTLPGSSAQTVTASAPAIGAARQAGMQPAGAEATEGKAGFHAGVLDGGRMVFRRTADGYAMITAGVDRTAGAAMNFLRQSAALVLPER
jgi:hypothetical protein